MELKNRILEIIENSGLTPSEFADKIEVQRSAISHITSGRNNPSLDFLIKIKNAFPEIDTDWLIFGIEKEEIYEEISDEKENTENSATSHPTLFDLFETDENVEETQSEEENSRKISKDKKMVRALLFFSDGSFEEFVPSE